MKNDLLRKKAAEPEDPVETEAVTEPVALDPHLESDIREYAQNHRSEIYRAELGDPTRFRDLLAITDHFDMRDYLVAKDLSGSNMSGSSVHTSNYRTFLKLYADVPGVFKIEGGHRSFGVAIRLSAVTEDMLKTLSGMDDYASLDDDEASNIQNEAIAEAWSDWACYDFIRALESELPEQEAAIDSLSEDDALKLFNELRQRVSAEWVHETGNSAYIDVEAVARACSKSDLPKVDPPKEAPESE